MAKQNTPRYLRKKAEKLFKANKLREAGSIYVPLCQSLPNDINSWLNLAVIYRQLNDYYNCEKCCKHVLGLSPDNTLALHTLAIAKHIAGERQTAINLYHKALDSEKPLNETYYLLANAYREIGNINNAQYYYEKLLELEPSHFEATNNLAAIYTHRGIIGKSITLLQNANRIKPNFPFVMNNLGKAYQISGQQHLAADTFRSILDKGQFDLDMVSNYLLSLCYLPATDQKFIYNEHVKWSKEFSNTEHNRGTTRHNIGNDNTIHLGFVSPDFKDHPVSHFILPFFRNYSRDSFNIHCYSDVVSNDHVTIELKSLVDHWTDCHQLDNNQLLSTIKNDKIDILIDLTGHTANNRMGVFAEKPAMIQCSYIGYPNTTGIDAIDYRLVDNITDPIETSDHFHSEKLMRLPGCFLSYCPDFSDTPEIRENNCNEIMFGSFNNLAKVTPEVVSLWSDILNSTKNSKLTLKSATTSDPDVQSYYLNQFEKCHIDSDRIIFLNSLANKEDHYKCYNSIDIALDTFPYNGTTTTFEALWMGVPVVTMTGQFHASRVGHSILSNVSLDNLVAHSKEEYQRIAVNLASDKSFLNELHASLRKRMENSSLLDHKQHTQQLETIFKTAFNEAILTVDN